MLAWIDLETTGIDPKIDQILEAGIIITPDDLGKILVEVSTVIRPKEPVTMRLDALRVHAASGLLAELEKGRDLAVAEDFLLAAISAYVPVPSTAQKLRIAGYNPQFDRSFLYEHMPRLLRAFHYRSVDVATLTWAHQRWTKEDAREKPTSFEAGEMKHRALDDIRQTIEKAKEIMPIFKSWNDAFRGSALDGSVNVGNAG